MVNELDYNALEFEDILELHKNLQNLLKDGIDFASIYGEPETQPKTETNKENLIDLFGHEPNLIDKIADEAKLDKIADKAEKEYLDDLDKVIGQKAQNFNTIKNSIKKL